MTIKLSSVLKNISNMTTACLKLLLLCGYKGDIIMFEKFIQLFFTRKKVENRHITYLGKQREIAKDVLLNNVKEDKHVETCMSKYFKNIKGLNVKNRGYAEYVNDEYSRLKFLKSVDSYRK